jgi:type IX secretion system PorP/SprF family membrane protein
MKRCIAIVFCILLFSELPAQSVQYSEFMLNDYGLNPAVAGSSKGLMFMVGRRTQWRGFGLSPETNFASFTKELGKKGYRRYWHGVGAYVEQDKYGLFSFKSAYGTYAVHLKLSAKYHIGFGVSAGMKQVAMSASLLDVNDPAFTVRNQAVTIPDIIPGIYLYSKRMFGGLSLRNIYQNALRQGGKQIGTQSKLSPTVYATVGRKFVSGGYDFIFVPAIHLQTTFTKIPVTSFNFMTYYRKRIGLGITYRMHDAVSAMVQVRVFSNVVIGFAYDYTISRFRSAHANSTEVMFGMSPVMSNENYDRPMGAADCPKFEL